MIVINVIILVILLLLASYCVKLKLQDRPQVDTSSPLNDVNLRVCSDDIMLYVRNATDNFRPYLEDRQILFDVKCTPDSMMGWIDTDIIDKLVILLSADMIANTPARGKITVEAYVNDTYDTITIRINDSSSVPLRVSLVIARQLVHLHHGTISSEFYKGQGNMVIMQMPIKKDQYLQEEIWEPGQDGEPVGITPSVFHIPSNIQLNVPTIELPEGVSDGTQSLGSLVQQAFSSPDQQFLQRAVKCVNDHIEDTDYDRDSFAADMGASASTLYNKLRALTGKNVTAFIRDIRIQTACKLAKENPELRVSDIAYRVGFKDPKYFATTFRKQMGVQPRDYFERLRRVR